MKNIRCGKIYLYQCVISISLSKAVESVLGQANLASQVFAIPSMSIFRDRRGDTLAWAECTKPPRGRGEQ